MRSMCDATSLCCCIIVLVIATSDRQLILRKGFVWPCGYLCVWGGGGGGGRSSRDCSDKGETNEGELGVDCEDKRRTLF